ncbi:MAG: FG-GAP-like repeat-containing protein [Bacteroidales bacterium]|jgi:hypothetical protein|nr:FG-GAP-like repeat-containing protein [Bacteroidales bacterium]
MCTKIFNEISVRDNFYTNLIRGVIIFIISIASFALIAQQGNITARNDTIKVGPLEKVKRNILINDVIKEDNYSWQLITTPDPIRQGTAVIDGDFFIFTPSASCRDTAFDLQYKLIVNEKESTAIIHIKVSKYNSPLNVVDPDVKCVKNMPSGIAFRVNEKFKNTDIALDGFSMPLIGDINGNGKPDIIALGLGRTGGFTDGNSLAARAWYVHIFDGQTGERVWSVNFGVEPASIAYANVTELGHEGITTNANEETDQFQLRYDPRHNSPGHLAIADLDNDGLGEIVVVECGNLGKIYALKPIVDAAKEIIGFSVMWYGNIYGGQYSYKSPISKNHEIFGSGVPYITNINGDDIPEVIVYNKIFNGRTGEVVCVLETLDNFGFPNSSTINKIKNNYAYVGRRPGAAWNDSHIPCMAITDINDDGILDIIAGSKVYIMKDYMGMPALDYIIYGPSKITTQRGNDPNDMTTVYVADGFTAVADIDMDGFLDVIVLAPATNSLSGATENILYVWDPILDAGGVKAAVFLYTKSVTGTMSFPFVGDINGWIDSYNRDKSLPEICFNGGRFYTAHSRASQIAFHPLSSSDLTYEGIVGASSNSGFNHDPARPLFGHIVGFTYHADPRGSTPLHERLKLSWAMEHGDESSCTGITMFDFDNDDIKELCYRDETSVRVIAPALRTYIPITEDVSPTSSIRFKQSDIRSYTGFEAPVIADVDMDGSADIVTLAYPSSESAGRSKGFVYVFEHASGYDKWAPCPPVWNQTIYFPLQINEDLTVPAKPQSMLTSYVNKNGKLIHPYNGQWIQQPIVKGESPYVPVVRDPDMVIHNMTVKVINNSSSTVTLTISNQGSASINAQTPITFYNGGATGLAIGTGATRIRTLPVGVDIFPGEKITHSYTLWGNFINNLIWVRLVDDYRNFPATGYDECVLSNNVFSAIDCPDFIYNVTATNNGVLCDTVPVVLTATPVNPATAPVYQWYHNDKLLIGDTGQTCTVYNVGDYKCYVVDGICRGFSSTTTLKRPLISFHNDYRSTMVGSQIMIGVSRNDQISQQCNYHLHITEFPVNGTAFVVNDSILYIPNAGFWGRDSLEYSAYAHAHAKVYITVYDFPDNIKEPNCISDPPPLSWVIDKPQLPAFRHSTCQITLVGDLDSDGSSELLSVKQRNSTNFKEGFYTDGINIYDMKTASFKMITTAEYVTSDLGLLGIAKAQASDTEALIVVSARDGYLYAYNKAGTQQWKSDARYTDVSPPSTHTYLTGAVAFADFNADGYAEVYIRDKIFDLKTGALLLDLDDEITTINEMGSTAADINKDGSLELIIRGKIYHIDIKNRTGTAGNTASLWKEVNKNPHPNAGLMTIAVDFDLDGRLEILVNAEDWFYIWSPYTGDVIMSQAKGTYWGRGCPAVGDIDGDGYPEIVYASQKRIIAWDIDGKTTATVKWGIVTTDVSGSTGITLFDFDQDGIVEILYRDETHVKIIDGSNPNAVRKDLVAIPSTSGTQCEYPVIADIDNDGQAEIVIVGGNESESAPYSGVLQIFKAGAGNKWAPARRVWNQYAYNAININEDLSVPKTQISQAIRFHGKDSLIRTADDIHPYNTFLQQQSILDKNGNLLWILPDVQIVDKPALHYYTIGDSIQILINITNSGDIPLGAPFNISIYQNAVTESNKMITTTYNRTINKGDTFRIDICIPKISSYKSFNSIIIRLNDNGKAAYEKQECDYATNERTVLKKDILMAHHDYVSTITDPISINVLDNDSLPLGCRQSVVIDTITGGGAKHGTLVIKSDTFTYTPDAGFYGIDSMTYYLKCNIDSTVARVYVIVNKPLNLMYIACAGASVDIGFTPLPGMKYLWFNTDTGTSPLKEANTITVVKNANMIQSFWAEPQYQGVKLPRYRIDLKLSLDCGRTHPVGCMLDGILLFKEDFGGNSPADPHTKSSGIPQVDKYTYSSTLDGYSVYSIAKTTANFRKSFWYKNIGDHTFPNDNTRGYLIGFDAASSPGQFYKHQIDGLCGGIELYFSAWITSLIVNLSHTHRANLIFLLEDTLQNTLAKFYTGDIPDADSAWKSYGFQFTVPNGQTSIVLKIINNGTGSDGNDFVLDDIELHLCSPDIAISGLTANDTALCTGSSLSLRGDYVDNGAYGNDLLYHWEFNASGNLMADSAWKIIPNTSGTSSNGHVSVGYDIDSATKLHSGYYCLVLGNKEIINQSKCKARSRYLRISVDSIPVLDVVRDTLLCTMENLINLVRYVSPNTDIQFYRDSAGMTALTSPLIHIHSDTTFYGRAIDKTTGCKSRLKAIHIRQGTYPPNVPTTGENKFCINDTVLLNNASVDGGVWSVSNPSIIKLIEATPNSVKVVGLKTGKAFVSYTTGKPSCQTRITFQVKVFRKRNTKVIIGIER